MLQFFNVILLGPIQYEEREEYLRFRHQVLAVLLIFGCFSSSFFLVSHKLGHAFDPLFVHSLQCHLMLTAGLYVLLYGRKQRFRLVAWSYAVVCYLHFIAIHLLVPSDELRVLWYLISLPGVYLLLGRWAGVGATLFSIACLVFMNPYLERPYSTYALATSILASLSLSTLFLAFSLQSVSFFRRMLESKEQLRFLATHDPLTGVLNARAYYTSCNQLISVSRRQDAEFAVLFVDLDHFKRINDTHGHEAGDEVLKALAHCIGRTLRASDVLGRIGGEEFSAFLPGADCASGSAVAEKLRLAIEQLHPEVAGQALSVTASIGVASGKSGLNTIAEIQHVADEAMYQSKREGRNRVTCIEGRQRA